LNQTFRDLELILIDDASKDGTEGICREYAEQDERVRYIRHEKNSGKPAVRYNDGMKLAKSNYFLFMFDDDMWLPNCVQDLYDEIRKDNSVGMVYGLADFINTGSGVTVEGFGEPWNYEKLKDEGNYLCNLSVILKRDVINCVGGYDESPLLRRLCDWDLWVRIGSQFKVVRLERVIGKCFHSQGDSIGSTVALSVDDLRKIRLIQRGKRAVRLKGEMKKMNKLVFAFTEHDAVLTRWNIIYIANALKEEGINVSVVDVRTEEGKSVCRDSDTVIFYRTNDQSSLNLLRELKTEGKSVFYSIDDYIFQPDCKIIEEDNGLIKLFIDECDGVISPSKYLLSKIPDNKRKIYRKNFLGKEAKDLFINGVVAKSDEFVIGWLTGINRHEMDFFVRDYLKFLDKALNKEKVRFVCFGKHRLGKLKNIKVEELDYFELEDWKGLYSKYRELGLDVVINPVKDDDEFFRCKSELKYIEAGALGTPLIVTKIQPFVDVVKDGVTGLFANTPEEFVEKTLLLFQQRDLLKDMSKSVLDDIEREYDESKIAKELLAELTSVKSRVVESAKPDVDFKEEMEDVVDSVKETVVEKVFNWVLGNLSVSDDGIVGPIYPLAEFKMELSSCPFGLVSELHVLGATYQKFVRNSADYRVYVNNEKVREGKISAHGMKDNTWWKMVFDPIKVEEGDSLSFVIIHRDVGTNITFRTCEDKKFGIAKVGARVVPPVAMRIVIDQGEK
jgi:glycosyltransferase involved in cell wall biosynthesis